MFDVPGPSRFWFGCLRHLCRQAFSPSLPLQQRGAVLARPAWSGMDEHPKLWVTVVGACRKQVFCCFAYAFWGILGGPGIWGSGQPDLGLTTK